MNKLQMIDYLGNYNVPGAFQVSGVKRYGIDENGRELFESCEPHSEEVIGWTISYDGVVWCPIVFKTEGDVKAAIELMVSMFHYGVRHNQFKVKEVLGIS